MDVWKHLIAAGFGDAYDARRISEQTSSLTLAVTDEKLCGCTGMKTVS
jgi:hypothetical protein